MTKSRDKLDTETIKKPPLDFSAGLMRSVLGGVIPPLVTIPIDQLQTKMVNSPLSFFQFFKLNPEIKNVWAHPLKNHSLIWKNYEFIAVGNTLRYLLTNTVSIALQKNFPAKKINQQKKEFTANAIAGGIEGIFASTGKYLTNKAWLSNQKILTIIKNQSGFELLNNIANTARFSVFRGGIFWSTYNEVLSRLEAKHSKTQAKNKAVQFVDGAISGVCATSLATPFDTLMKKRINDPNFSAYKYISQSFKQGGKFGLLKAMYPGFGLVVLRIGPAMGITNLAFKVADFLHNSYFPLTVNAEKQTIVPPANPSVEMTTISSDKTPDLFFFKRFKAVADSVEKNPHPRSIIVPLR